MGPSHRAARVKLVQFRGSGGSVSSQMPPLQPGSPEAIPSTGQVPPQIPPLQPISPELILIPSQIPPLEPISPEPSLVPSPTPPLQPVSPEPILVPSDPDSYDNSRVEGSPLDPNERVVQDDILPSSGVMDNESASDNTDGWKTLLEAMDGSDEKMLDNWKEELANLLTFTGLFSAVVTGFIVVTIPSLQEDKTVNLLAQISQQMSSFSVGSKFANSTFQPPSSSAQFQANRSDVQVNTLWTISLSLTLLSAFMAITAQQWIRRVSRPRQMAVRDAVRLRQFRHDGLADWQVPTIISLLPIVVQLSVILFLAGLLLFMQTVNTTVFVALLIVITGIVGPFIIASACPLVWSQCPYKSPLLPTLWTIIRSCSFPVLVTAMVLLLSIVALTYGLSTVVWNIVMSVTPSNHPFARFHAIFMQTIDAVDAWLYNHLRSLFSRHPYESDHFWTARESHFIQKHMSDIDISAFCWSAIGVPTESVEKVADCLYDLPRLKRVHAGLRWAALSMGRSFFDFNQWFVVRTPIYSGVERALRRSTGIYKILSKSFVPQEGDESGKFAWIADNNWAPPQPTPARS